MTTIIISLVIGFAVGCFINYAITFRTGQARNIGLCIGGALVGGAIIPWLLSMSSVVAAIIGSLIGIAIVLWIMFKTTRTA